MRTKEQIDRLLRTPDQLLTDLDRQAKYVIQTNSHPMPCPNCRRPVNQYEAGGFGPEEDDFHAGNRPFRCPDCKRELLVVVPFIRIGPGWCWELVPEVINKAKP